MNHLIIILLLCVTYVHACTLQSDDNGRFDVDFLSSSNDSLCYVITTNDSTKYINKDSIHLKINITTRISKYIAIVLTCKYILVDSIKNRVACTYMYINLY